MKLLPLLLATSLATNALLLWLAWPKPGSPGEAFDWFSSSPVSQETAAQLGKNTAVPNPFSSTSSATPLWRSEGIADLDGLLARLRAAGVPPREIQAILMAVIEAHFSAKQRALRAETDSAPYWQVRYRAPNSELQSQRLALYAEQEKLARKYLLDPELFAANTEMLDMSRRMFGPLSIDRLRALIGLEMEFQQRSMEAARAQRSTQPGAPRYGTPEGPWGALREEKLAAARAVLTPAEFEQYELRTSEISARLRSSLDAFQPTEAEFKALFAIEKTFGAQSDNLTKDQRKALEQSKLAQITATLGAARAAEYSLAAKPENRVLGTLLNRLGLPLATISSVNAVRDQSTEQIRAIFGNKDLDAAARTAGLETIASEVREKLTAALGPRGFEAYTESYGEWVNTITSAGKPGKP